MTPNSSSSSSYNGTPALLQVKKRAVTYKKYAPACFFIAPRICAVLRARTVCFFSSVLWQKRFLLKSTRLRFFIAPRICTILRARPAIFTLWFFEGNFFRSTRLRLFSLRLLTIFQKLWHNNCGVQFHIFPLREAFSVKVLPTSRQEKLYANTREAFFGAFP